MPAIHAVAILRARIAERTVAEAEERHLSRRENVPGNPTRGR